MTTGDHLKPMAVDKKPSREVFIIAKKTWWKFSQKKIEPRG